MGLETSFSLNMIVVLACHMLDILRFAVVVHVRPLVAILLVSQLCLARHPTAKCFHMSAVTASPVANFTCMWHLGQIRPVVWFA